MQVLQTGHIGPIDRSAVYFHLFKINQPFGKGYMGEIEITEIIFTRGYSFRKVYRQLKILVF